MSLQYFEEKISFFYQNVYLSFYLNIVCKNIVCDVGLKLMKTHFLDRESWLVPDFHCFHFLTIVVIFIFLRNLITFLFVV